MSERAQVYYLGCNFVRGVPVFIAELGYEPRAGELTTVTTVTSNRRVVRYGFCVFCFDRVPPHRGARPVSSVASTGGR
eukprot:g9753.t1